MKLGIILLLLTALLSAQETKRTSGYYLTLKDFVDNTPVPAEKQTKVQEGRIKEKGNETRYFLYERENEESEFKKVRAKSFKGYCDNGELYLVNGVDLILGRTMRKVIEGKKYSYYFGTLRVAGAGGGMSGAGGFSMNVSTGGTVPLLEVIDMKTGKTTTLKISVAIKRKMRRLLSDSPALFAEYKAAKNRTLEYAAIYLDKVNSLE